MKNPMQEIKNKNVPSPDLNNLQAVIIDSKTTIYITRDKDPEQARTRYLKLHEQKDNFHNYIKKSDLEIHK